MDWKLELVAIPVSDVDRAKAFYTEQAGFNADHDHTVSDEVRFVQLTPPGSACSIALGKGVTDAEPGSVKGMQMVVSDIEAAHAAGAIGVGVASGVHVYAKEKTASVAVLRCIGANPTETVMVYLIQVLMLTLGGSIVGALLGASLSFLLPVALKDFLPVNAVMIIAPFGIVVGLLVGLGTVAGLIAVCTIVALAVGVVTASS